MNLLIISDYLPKKNNPIAGNFVTYQASQLKESYDKVTIVHLVPLGKNDSPAISVDGVDIKSESYISLPQVSNLKFINKIIYRFNILSYALKMYFVLKRIGCYRSNNVNLRVLVHGHRVSAPGLSFLHKLLKKFKSIVVIHGEDPFLQSNSYVYEKKFLSCYDRVVLVGSSLMSHLTQIVGGIKESIVVHNGSVKFDFLESKSDCKKIKIVSVCNLNSNKKIDQVLRTLSTIDNNKSWEYKIIGDGPECKKLKLLTNELGLASKVSFLGRLSHYDTHKNIMMSDIFVLPSILESFGIVYVEAMSYGVVPIGCVGTGAEEIIENDHNGYLVEKNCDKQLKEKLTLLINHESVRLKIAKRAIERSLYFTWERNVKEINRIFNEIE